MADGRFLPTYLHSNLSSVMPVKCFLPFVLDIFFWRKKSLNLYHENLVWTFKTNSSVGTTEHSLNILCLFWSLGRTWQYRKPSQSLKFPKKLPCEGEMFSRSWNFQLIEQGDEMAAGSRGNFLWGRVHIQDISVPGKFCQGC